MRPQTNYLSKLMPKHLTIITCLASSLFAACVYKIDVQQGNIVTQEMVDQLRPGMNEKQVRFIMGTPLLIDSFHKQRWDYIYSNQPSREERTQKRITLFFKNQELVSMQGDFRPNESLSAAETEETVVVVPKRDVQKTVFQKIQGLFGFGDD